METCCVIPPELSLVLRMDPDQVKQILEMTVTVWSNRTLNPGITFRPDQGQVRLEKLEVYRQLKKKDIRRRFGCFDDVHDVDEEEVRHCNWVRFVQACTNIDEVNMVAVRVKGQPIFQVVRVIPPNTELKVFFDESEENQSESAASSVKMEEDSGPLCSPYRMTSPRSSATRSLMTPNSDREDDCRSPTASDVTSGSDDSLHTSKSNLSGSPSSDVNSPFRRKSTTPNSSPLPPMPGSSDRSLFTSPPSGFTSPQSEFTSPPSEFTSTPPDFTSPPSGFTSPEFTSPPSTLTSPLSGPDDPSPARMPVKRNRERTWLPCEVCGKKFDRPSLLRRHMRTHTGEKPHACDVCGKAFSTSSSLNTHRRIHSGEKPHQCQVCGKRFTASSNLYYHRMTHNKEKPHKCTLCSKSFPTPGDLKSHMYVHNGSWPFKCDICNRGFSKQTNLKNHLLLHTGDKPHECQLCGKRFALQCNLKTHMKTHEGEPQEECYKCGKVSLVSSNQLLNGYCRPCLGQVSHFDKSPLMSRPSNSFNVEALTSPSHPHRPAAIRGHMSHGIHRVHMPTVSMPGTPPGAFAASYAHAVMPLGGRGLPPAMHPGSGLLHYGPGLSWPKLVPPQY